MIDLSIFAGQRIAVLGLGRSGYNAARALQAGGAHVLAWDDDVRRRDACVAASLPLADLGRADWSRMDMLVLSPGIPHRHPAPHPVAAMAKAASCPIVSDVELLFRARPHATYVGITGTNGKSTTTSLIGHMLAAAGRAVEVGGNLGTPALTLSPLSEGGIYVLEMSSYQLEITPGMALTVAVLINISADHLDRHGGMAGYVAAKRLIFNNAGTAVIGIDDDNCRQVRDALTRVEGLRIATISGSNAKADIYVEGRRLVDRATGQTVADLSQATALPGVHNGQNAAAAYAAVRALGVGIDQAARGLLTFPGLAHRQERIATIRGVHYINDSKATNAEATAHALDSYETIYWIAGGLPKEGGITALAPFFPHVAHAFLIGTAANEFAHTLEGRVAHTVSGDLETALRAAHAAAQRSDRRPAVVLLSPACASFDQFANFEARGEAFRRLVGELAAEQDTEPLRGGAAA
ncbi:MAG: UDP-N-acetylmuramoyl-L-alanine--D-glutamate ligase [Alphaproteobacteria bacterium]